MITTTTASGSSAFYQGVIENVDHLSGDVLRRGFHVRPASLRAKNHRVRKVRWVPLSLRKDSDQPHVGPHFGLFSVVHKSAGGGARAGYMTKGWCVWGRGFFSSIETSGAGRESRKM